MHDKYNQNFRLDSASLIAYRNEILQRINLVNEFYPKNARTILDAWAQSKSEKTALQMLAAVDLKLKDNKAYQRKLRTLLAKNGDSDRHHIVGEVSCKHTNFGDSVAIIGLS